MNARPQPKKSIKGDRDSVGSGSDMLLPAPCCI